MCNISREKVVVLRLISVLWICTMYIFLEKYLRSVHFINPRSSNTYLIDTEGCKIPAFDPFDPLIRSNLDSGDELKCDPNKELLYAVNNTICINKELVRKKRPSLTYCKYDVIWRPPNEVKDHNFYTYVNESVPFFTNVTVNEEFVRVRCYNKKHSLVYTNAFSFVHPKPSVEKRCKERREKSSGKASEDLSVLLLGIDSVSRNNMLRYMPKTRSFLLNNMSAIELLGYNKVADNTFVNIVPMTTGKFVKDLPWSEDMTNVTFEKYDFIWKKFSERGYRTLYAEDAPVIQIFDYQKAGFGKSPTDYFNRVFSVAIETIKSIWNTGHNCLHGRAESHIMLDYLRQFVTTFSLLPSFSFTFISRLTHDTLSDTSLADEIYYDFLTKINHDITLNKTAVFFFSDHGIRFGKVRQTAIGRLEERLPFMFLIFPPWFLTKYPEVKNNLQINSERLTTPFDIYETLHDLLNFKTQSRKISVNQRGISLFDEIPSTRTCEHAGILPHWCTCSINKNVSLSNQKVVTIAHMFVERLNTIVKNFKECSNISLSKIMDASQLGTSEKVLSYVKRLSEVSNKVIYGESVDAYIDYLIIIKTNPGAAVFEGTFRFNEEYKTLQILGDISRINRYGNQSYCVKETNLKKFCYCRIQNPG